MPEVLLSSSHSLRTPAFFSLPMCCGIIGGRPSFSFYIIGRQGNAFHYLDPHTVQTAACKRDDVSDENDDGHLPSFLSSFSPPSICSLSSSSLDPSMVLCFYCGDVDDVDSLLDTFSRSAAFRAVLSVELAKSEGKEQQVIDIDGEDIVVIENE